MTIIRYITPDGQTHELDLANGTTLMEGSVANGLEGIVGECGGAAMCATCHVYVDETDLARLQPIDENEDEMLDVTASPRQPNSRLACQIDVTPAIDGLTVRIAEEQY